jgi:peptidylprolyl isomerase
MSTTPPTRTAKRQRKKEGAAARRAAEVAALRRQQRNRRVIRIGVIVVLVVGAMFLISALGGDDNDETDVATDSESTTTVAGESTTTTTAAPIPATPLSCAEPDGSNTDLATKPTVTVPDAPVTELTCQDLVIGDGDEVKNSNDVVEVQYVGVAQSDGKEFDSSWSRGQTATFGLDGVIDGWTEGIPGMKVGGRRVLTIPADKAYGDEGDPGGTLVFIVDLIAVNPAPDAANG